MYREVMGDILRIKEGAIAHCITADYSLGAGLAKDLDNKYNLKSKLMNYPISTVPNCILIQDNDLVIFNLVTKNTRWDNPQYEDLKECLIMMKDEMKKRKIKRVYVPQLGCGKDKLKWDLVKDIFKEVFSSEKDIELCVFYYIPPRT